MPAKAIESVSDFKGNEDTIRKLPSEQGFERCQKVNNLHYKHDSNISLFFFIFLSSQTDVGIHEDQY